MMKLVFAVFTVLVGVSVGAVANAISWRVSGKPFTIFESVMVTSVTVIMMNTMVTASGLSRKGK